jgi:oligopeptide/dipeptide ABC transporter ATP-binding protein
VGLAGESGCGKSTLAYGAVRLLRPPAVITSGRVRYTGRRVGPDGVDALAASPAQLRTLRWREIAIVFQSAMNGLNPVLRVRDQLLDALDAHVRLSDEERHERIATLVELVGIPRARLRSYPHELSGGMRQRVMIAMALVAEPEVVIMDEPTTALDVVVQREIVTELFALRERLQFAVLFITHDLSLLLEIADRVLVMYAGELVEGASAESIGRRPAHPYTRGLLRSFPRLRGPRQRLSGIPGAPPDLREDLVGCPFLPRCSFAQEACQQVDMCLAPVGGCEAAHVTACPFVGADDPEPQLGAAAVAARNAGAAIVDRAPRTRGALVLEATALSKDFRLGGGRRAARLSAVKDVSLSLYRGTVVALVGESGSGKTTVARLLAGQEPRTGGRITLDGLELDPSSRRTFRSYKSDVQMVFQDPFASLNPFHTVNYHLQRALHVHRARTGAGASSHEVEQSLDEAMDRSSTTIARRGFGARERGAARRLRERRLELEHPKRRRLELCRAHDGVEPAELDHAELQSIRAVVRGDAARSDDADLRAADPVQRDQARQPVLLAGEWLHVVQRR